MVERTPEEAARRRRNLWVLIVGFALMAAAVVIYVTTFDLMWSAIAVVAAFAIVLFCGLIPNLLSKRGSR